MKNKDKPRICEVLGVEVGQAFQAFTPHMIYEHLEIAPDGVVWAIGKTKKNKVEPRSLCFMINCPDSIRKVPRWTPEEVELAKAIKVVWPEAKEIFCPKGVNHDWVMVCNIDEESIFGCDPTRFPSMHPGETVMLSDIIGGDKNA